MGAELTDGHGYARRAEVREAILDSEKRWERLLSAETERRDRESQAMILRIERNADRIDKVESRLDRYLGIAVVTPWLLSAVLTIFLIADRFGLSIP